MAKHTKECLAAAMHRSIDGWLEAPRSIVNDFVFEKCLNDGTIVRSTFDALDSGEAPCLCATEKEQKS
jgi:hypothetical protein